MRCPPSPPVCRINAADEDRKRVVEELHQAELAYVAVMADQQAELLAIVQAVPPPPTKSL